MQKRRLEIKKLLAATGFVDVRELVNRFHVSSETIRRDLEALEKTGDLKRIHGGAVNIHQEADETAYQARQISHKAEKIAIATAAADMIEDGDSLIITPGTTTLEVATLLKDRERITVITNSLPIAMELAGCKGISVVLLGGSVRDTDFSTSGVITMDNLAAFNADKLIMGIGGITPYHGITDYRMDESALLRAFIARVNTVIGVTDHSKFGVVSTYNICAADMLDHLITDGDAPQEACEQLSSMGVHVHIMTAKS